jgi:L-lysine 2,3-aminomutase
MLAVAPLEKLIRLLRELPYIEMIRFGARLALTF